MQSTYIRCAHANSGVSRWTLKRLKSHKKRTKFIRWHSHESPLSLKIHAQVIVTNGMFAMYVRTLWNTNLRRFVCHFHWMFADRLRAEDRGGLRKLLFNRIATNSIFFSPTQFTWREHQCQLAFCRHHTAARLYVNGLQCESAVKIRITIMAITNFVSLTLFFITFVLMSLAVGTLQIWKTGESAQLAYANHNHSLVFLSPFLGNWILIFAHRRKWLCYCLLRISKVCPDCRLHSFRRVHAHCFVHLCDFYVFLEFNSTWCDHFVADYYVIATQN